AIAFNLYWLWPEVAISVPQLNDGVLHQLLLGRTVAALASGENVTDHWLAPIGMGYPLFHYYQHFAYLLPALAEYFSVFVLHVALPIADLLSWTTYLLLCLFPVSVYWSVRRVGFERPAAAFAALAASLLVTNGLYGFDYNSYVWRGFGLYTQLWGMLLLPPTLAQGYVILKTSRGYFWGVLLLAALLLSHLVLGYIGLVSLVAVALFVAISRWKLSEIGATLRRGGPRLAILLGLTALVTGYFFLPFLTENAYMNRSVWELTGKYDSYGYQWVLGALIKGQLFDFGRFPSLTLLAGAGLVFCLFHWREERYRIPVILFVVWLLLYFGRPTWGVLLNLLPMSRDLQMHRLIAGVHLAGLLLIGIGLAAPWHWAIARGGGRYLLAPALLTLLLLYPVYRERDAYFTQNATWMGESQQAFAAEQPDLTALMDTLSSLPPGRVYAGLAGTWGKQYRVGAVPIYALLTANGFDSLGFLYHALSLNADVQVRFDESRADEYNLFNVRYVVAPIDHPFPAFVKPIRDFGRHRLYQVDTTGYFDVVDSPFAFAGTKGDWYPPADAWLKGSLPQGKIHPSIFLSGAGSQPSAVQPLAQARAIIAQQVSLPHPAAGRVLAEAVEPDAYQAKVTVDRASMVMLKSTYHPNWRAWVDGVETRPVMLMPSFIGVPVAPGQHLVQLEYQPQPLRRYLLTLGMLILAILGTTEWPREWLARPARRLGLDRLPPAERQAARAAIERAPQFASLVSTLRTRTVSSKLWVATALEAGRRRARSWAGLRAAQSWLSPHFPFLVGVTLLALLAGLPLFQFKVMSGHDALEYLPRTIEFQRALSAGQLFPRWAPDLSGGYGQPFFSFNPPVFYYAATAFYALGFSFVAAQNLAIFALIWLAGLGMYALAADVYGRRGGLVAATAYLYAPYFLVTLYVRAALADFAAFAFIPLAIWGLYRFAHGGRTVFAMVGALAVALLLLSSNTVTLIACPVLALLVVWQAYTERSWPTLLRGAGCLLLGLGLSAFFWLPALVERNFVHTARLLEGYLSYRNHFVYPQQLIFSPWGYGLSLTGPVDGMSFEIGYVQLGLAVAGLVVLWRIRRAGGRHIQLLSFGLALLVAAAFFASTLSQFLWDGLPLLQYLEFPWRFLSLAAVGAALVCGSPFLLLGTRRPRLANGLAALLIAGLFLANFSHAQPEKLYDIVDDDYNPQTIAARWISVTTAEEYEPVWVTERPQAPAAEPLTFMAGTGRVGIISLSPTYREFHVDAAQPARLRLNTFYFPGWTLTVDGAERTIDYTNPQGVIEFLLEPGQHVVRFRFVDTPIRWWGTILSLLTLLLSLSALWMARKRNWRMATNLDSGMRPAMPLHLEPLPAPLEQAAQTVTDRAGMLYRRVLTLRAPAVVPQESALVASRTKLGLYLLFFSIYLLSGAGHFFSTDHISVYQTTASLVERGSLTIPHILDTVRSQDGNYYSPFGLGQSLALIPWYLVGTFVDGISGPMLKSYFGGAQLGMWGGTVPIFFASLFNQFVMPLLCLLVFLFCLRLGFKYRIALATTLIFGFSTSAWVYARDSFQHPLEALLLLLSIYILFVHRGDLRYKHALLAGCLLALGILTRINLLLVAPAVAGYLFCILPEHQGATAIPSQKIDWIGNIRQRLQQVWLKRANRATVQYMLVFGLPIVIMLALIMYLNQIRFGSALIFNGTSQAQGFTTPLLVGLYGNLFSVGRSVFLYSPPTLLALCTFRMFYRQYRAEAVLFLAISATYLVLFSKFTLWHGGWSWGPRYFMPIVPLLILPLGYFVTGGWRNAIVGLLAVLGIGVQLLGVTINYSYVYSNWLHADRLPVNIYLFVPELSAIPTHLYMLAAGRYVDVWLLQVYKQFGLSAFLLTVSVPLLILAASIALLRGWGVRPPEPTPADEADPPDSNSQANDAADQIDQPQL
ncbi:MAG: YfhO family protein, partial [Roseiflexaceae bacterium]